jgi:hypothetical protein
MKRVTLERPLKFGNSRACAMAGFTTKVVAAAYLYEKMARKEKRKRRFSVHPLIFLRGLKGAFVTLYTDLLEDETKLFNYFKRSSKTFYELFGKMESAFPGFHIIGLDCTSLMSTSVSTTASILQDEVNWTSEPPGMKRRL